MNEIQQYNQNRYSILTFGAAIVGVIVASAVNLNSNLISCNSKCCLEDVKTQYGLKITITYLLILIVLPSIFWIMYKLCFLSSKNIYNLKKERQSEESKEFVKILADILILASPLICAFNMFVYSLYLNHFSNSEGTNAYYEQFNAWLLLFCIAVYTIFFIIVHYSEKNHINNTFVADNEQK